MVGTLAVTARPLRYGFLVDPTDPSSVRQAIQAASTLWGASSGVLIPLFKRKPNGWNETAFRVGSVEQIVRGYIQAFDPDIFVLCTKSTPTYFKNLEIKTIPCEKIWLDEEGADTMMSPIVGVGIFELLEEVYKRDFKYIARHPVKLIFPRCEGKIGLFWAAVYGEYADPMKDRVVRFCADAMDPVVDELASTDQLKDSENLFPRRITWMDVETSSRSGSRDHSCVFFMDADNCLDIIDYWNLRAIGRSVLPVPIQLFDDEALKKLVIDFLESSRRPWKHNPQFFDTALFIKSRNAKKEDMDKYAKELNLNTKEEQYYSLQYWYPRIWDDWGRDKDAAEPADLSCSLVKTVEVEGDPMVVSIPSIVPSFVSKAGRYKRVQCANEIEFRSYGGRESFAQAYPKAPKESCLAAISQFSWDDNRWRVGKNGLVRLVKDDRSERWEVPLAEKVFLGWLKDLGWEVALSSAGMSAKQIVNQLNGFINPLSSETLIQLLDHMNGGGTSTDERPTTEPRALPVGEVRNRIKQGRDTDSLYELLIRQKVFKLGLTVQCPTCQRRSWYHLQLLNDLLECPKCTISFAAVGNVEGGRWQFKTAGPLSIPNYADGAISVLLAVRFLQINLDGFNSRFTSCFSFEGNKGDGKKLEADFGMLWDQSTVRGRYGGTIFGECKSYNEFKKKDVDKMKLMGEEFPGALLVFCTLRDELTAKEKRMISVLARWGRKYWKDELPRNPVMVLTKHEIFHWMGRPPNCWKELGQDKKFDHVHRDLYEIANATQQIHLGMDSWHDYWNSYFNKKRQRRQKKAALAPSSNPNPPQFS
jgi:hypothetical protein